MQGGGQGVEGLGGGHEAEESLHAVVGGGAGHQVVLRHRLRHAARDTWPGHAAPHLEYLGAAVVDGDEDGVGVGGGGEEGPRVRDQRGQGLLRPAPAPARPASWAATVVTMYPVLVWVCVTEEATADEVEEDVLYDLADLPRPHPAHPALLRRGHRGGGLGLGLGDHDPVRAVVGHLT